MFIDAVHQLSRCSSMPIKADRCLWHIYAKTDADVHCAGQIYSSSEMHSCACYGRKGVKLATTGMDGQAKSNSVGQMAWYTTVGQMVWYTTVGEIAQCTTVSVVRLCTAGIPQWVELVRLLSSRVNVPLPCILYLSSGKQQIQNQENLCRTNYTVDHIAQLMQT